MSKNNRQLEEFIERLSTDAQFRASFRSAPYDIAAEHGVSRAETDVILHGDSIDAALLGIDSEPGNLSRTRSWFPSLLLRVGGTAAAAVVALLMATAGAAPQASAARRTYISVRRVRARAGIRARARAGVRARWVVSPISVRAARARFSARAARAGVRAGIRATYYRAGGRADVRAGKGVWGRYASEADALKSLSAVFGELDEVRFDVEKPPVIVD